MRHNVIIWFLIITHSVAGQHILTEAETEWLKDNVVSFPNSISETAVNEFSSLAIPNEAKIIGLGEANHGTKEFHILKSQLALYLVEYEQLTTIAVEFPYSHGLLLNDYVTGKNENGLKILTNQKNSEYHTTQMVDFIDSIKELNKNRPDSTKIEFLGVDIFGKPYALKRLTDYFQLNDNLFYNRLLSSQPPFKDYYSGIPKENSEQYKSLAKDILKRLEKDKEKLIHSSSDLVYNRMVRLAELLSVDWKGNQRAIEGSKNIMFFLNERADTKILFLAHNMHVGRFAKDIGTQLSKKLNGEYFPIATDYNTGSFTLKNMTDRSNVFPDTVTVIPMDNSFAYNILFLNGKYHYLEFPKSASPECKWIFKPNYVSRTGSGFNQPFTSSKQFKDDFVLPKLFDAIFVFESISPTKILN